jgi:hypothetical protein
MAIILQFRPAAQSLLAADRRDDEAMSRAAKPVDAPCGEIIIFPGVRIERRAPSPTPTPAHTTPRRRAQRSRKK